MRGTLRALGGIVIAVAMVVAGAPSAARADVTMRLIGADVNGERMQGSCELRTLSPPSNTFVGRCEVVVGGERLTLAGLDFNGQPALSAVLNGRITIRGVAGAASGRFL